MKYLFACILFFLGACQNNYHIYQYDNGDDYVQDGMIRIVDKSTKKMGYATPDGKVVIKPEFAFGYPFKNGVAKVTYEGNLAEVKNSQAEYHIWQSSQWFYIDKQGNQVKR